MNFVPVYIQVKSKLVPLKKYEDTENLATGEIRKFENTSSVAKRVGMISMEGDYDIIWEHVMDDYYKQVSKTLNLRNC